MSERLGTPGERLPDGEAPLVLRLTERSVPLLLVGIGMIAAAVAVVRYAVVHPGSVQVPAPVAAVVLAVVVLFLGGLGSAVVVTFVRAPRHVVRIGPEGLLLGSGALWLDWEEVDAVGVRVVESDGTGRYVMPRRLHKHVLVLLVWCPDPAARRSTDVGSARHRLPAPFTHERLLASPPFAAGTDLPLVRDLDAALQSFAGPRYRGRTGP